MTPEERSRIQGIEQKLGPVGKGHHNSHRTAALLKWLRDHENEKNDTPKHEKSEPTSERKKEGE